jgi:hypothetical protein
MYFCEDGSDSIFVFLLVTSKGCERTGYEFSTPAATPEVRMNGKIREKTARASAVELDERQSCDLLPCRVIEVFAKDQRVHPWTGAVATFPPECLSPIVEALPLLCDREATYVEAVVNDPKESLISTVT